MYVPLFSLPPRLSSSSSGPCVAPWNDKVREAAEMFAFVNGGVSEKRGHMKEQFQKWVPLYIHYYGDEFTTDLFCSYLSTNPYKGKEMLKFFFSTIACSMIKKAKDAALNGEKKMEHEIVANILNSLELTSELTV